MKRSVFKKLPHPLRKFIQLESALAALLAIFVYTLISSWFFSSSVQIVDEKEGSLLLLSTESNGSLRASIESSITSAKTSVLLIIYTLTDKKIIAALKEAASRGVSVTVIYDPIASPELSFHLGKMIECVAHRTKGLMHQKLLVIDESIVWLGSSNMTPTSFFQHGNIMASIRSKALAKTIKMYGNALKSNQAWVEKPLQITFPQQTITLFLHPFQGQDSLSYLVKKIDEAKNRVFVAMYTFTNEPLVQALVRAHMRGVNVKVLFDKDSILQTSKKCYVRCKREGIFCSFRKKAGLLHYKTAIIDDSFVIGSANWTKAAFKDNDDSILVITPLSTDQKNWVNNWWKNVLATT